MYINDKIIDTRQKPIIKIKGLGYEGFIGTVAGDKIAKTGLSSAIFARVSCICVVI